MRSLRRSLTLYFLLLTAVGVGAVALFADRMIARSLQEKEKAVADAIRLQTELRVRAARDKLDDDLLLEARSRGNALQLQYPLMTGTEFTRVRNALTGATIASAAMSNPLHAAIAASVYSPVPLDRRGRAVGIQVPMITRHYFQHLILEGLDHEEGDRRTHYLQVNSTTGWMIWHSKDLGATTLPPNTSVLTSEKVIDWAYDDLDLPPIGKVRRVVLKASLGERWGGPRGGPGPGGPRGDPPRPQPQQGAEPPPPPQQRAIFIHCAVPLVDLNNQIGAIQEDSAGALDELAARIREDRDRFRLWVAGVGGATFLLIVVGGPLLINRGLSPVRKLSNAVTQVSEKDFRLSVTPDELTRELLPIHAGLTETLDQLRGAFAREKQAVSDISHELRTPLAGLLASMEVALRKPRTAESYRGTIEECRVIAKELSRLVERILVLAALDSGRAVVRLEAVDAHEIAECCARVIRPLVTSHDLAFEFEAEPGAILDTDADKLRDVLMNLLHNAIEYNRPGGTVRLRMAAADGRVSFEVADTGIGIAPELQGHIFERFFRADESRHATGVHAGLGLSLVKEYVDRLGGAISVTSAVNVGSTFRVTFPLKADDSPAPEDYPADSLSEPVPLAR